MILVGGRVLKVSGDRVFVQTEVGTNLRHFYSDQEFMVLDNNVEDFAMGKQWFNSIHNGAQDDHIKILDATIRGLGKSYRIWSRCGPYGRFIGVFQYCGVPGS